jgi:hypothetical protein
MSTDVYIRDTATDYHQQCGNYEIIPILVTTRCMLSKQKYLHVGLHLQQGFICEISGSHGGIFWDVVPCGLVEVYTKFLLDYRVQHARRQKIFSG